MKSTLLSLYASPGPFRNVKILFSLCGVCMLTSVLYVIAFRDLCSTYMRFGPNDHLNVAAVPIRSWTSYILLHIQLAFIELSVALMSELCDPLFQYSIFNVDRKIVTECSKQEIQVYNCLYSAIRSFQFTSRIIFITAQFDLLVSVIIYKESANLFCVSILLQDKEFFKSKEHNLYSPLRDMELDVFQEYDNSPNSNTNSDSYECKPVELKSV